MAAALVVTLLLPDWGGDGAPRTGLLFVPPLLGLGGALAAFAHPELRPRERALWTAVSAIWGVALVVALFVLLYGGG